MTQARRRHMARLERLAAPLLEQISVADEHGARVYGDALIHAANFSLIVLFGNPQIDEPVSVAWERCCKSDSPMLFNKFSNTNRLKDFGSPFDHRARWCAQYFRERVMPQLPGANDKEKFAPIFAGAPLWLLWFTWADATMAALDLPPRDHPDIRNFLRSKDNFFRWPALPSGKFENIQMSDIEIAEHARKAEERYALWDELADEIGPRRGLLELKYRYPERFVK